MKNRETIDKVLKALVKNKMVAYYVDTKEEARALALSLIPRGATCASGGSVTLKETGILDAVKLGSYCYFDRYAEGMTDAEREEAVKRAHFADVYLTSANAITENGELYNVDGNSNRISAIAHGPKNVIVVAGVNKIVKDLDEAILRVKAVAAPKNCARLNCQTPCFHTGHCISIDRSESTVMSAGCTSPARICCNYLVSAQQRHVSRIKVILVGEELGY